MSSSGGALPVASASVTRRARSRSLWMAGREPPRSCGARPRSASHAASSASPTVEQLVVEVFVRDVSRSKALCQQLGFDIAEDRGTFVVLTWEGNELFLDRRSDLPDPCHAPQANVRVMVPDVDAYWRRARGMG